MVHYERFLKVAWEMALPAARIRAIADRIKRPQDFYAWAKENLANLAVPANYSALDLEESRWNMFVMSRYIAEGERVFRIEPGLARLLLDTDLPAVHGEDLALPFPAVYLEFPGKLFVVPGPELTVIGCYLIDLRPEIQQISIEFMVEPHQNRKPGCGEFFLNVALDVSEGQPVHWGNLYQKFISELGCSASPEKTEFLKKTEAFAVEALQFIINSLLYATSAKPELTEVVSAWRPPKDKKQRKKNKLKPILGKNAPPAVPSTKKLLMGAGIKVEYGAPKATDRTVEAGTARKVLKRFRVRGHWHWYRYGKGADLFKFRRHLLILPYWKGPKDMAELLRRKYHIS